MILHATHSHLYPGHRGTVSGLARPEDLPSDHECLVEFSDGVAASARLSQRGDHWQLHTNAYRTAAGNDITEKYWQLLLQQEDGQTRFRITGKLQASDDA